MKGRERLREKGGEISLLRDGKEKRRVEKEYCTRTERRKRRRNCIYYLPKL